MTSLYTVKWGLAAGSKKIDRPKHGPYKETINTLLNLNIRTDLYQTLAKTSVEAKCTFLNVTCPMPEIKTLATMDGKTRALHQIEEEGHHIGETAEGPSTQITRGNTCRNRTMGLSYRRPNRSYTKEKTTKWTKQMNKELYRMYL